MFEKTFDCSYYKGHKIHVPQNEVNYEVKVEEITYNSIKPGKESKE